VLELVAACDAIELTRAVCAMQMYGALLKLPSTGGVMSASCRVCESVMCRVAHASLRHRRLYCAFPQSPVLVGKFWSKGRRHHRGRGHGGSPEGACWAVACAPRPRPSCRMPPICHFRSSLHKSYALSWCDQVMTPSVPSPLINGVPPRDRGMSPGSGDGAGVPPAE
jgi:hypothetical protein